jgi:CubicO group peptidase (beta-lactamase class C family)
MIGMTAVLFQAAALADDAEDIARHRHARALEGMVQSTGEEALRRFSNLHLAPAYCDSFPPGALLAHLERIRSHCAGFAGVLLQRMEDGGVRVRFLRENAETVVLFRTERTVPYGIVALELEAVSAPGRAQPEMTPVTWDNLEQRLDEEAGRGFSGVVLVVRGGRVVLHRGYGMADREGGVANTTETIFAIGSVPIDFTKAAVLKLGEMGKLRTSDSITAYFDAVPADKRSMTIDHLMTGASGLPDFHHVVGVDEDRDLSWIDRETAIRRILGQELLFPPGRGEAHSHSAWVLLAALVEIVSRRSYGDFLQEHFFQPAGMKRTALHEGLEGFQNDEIAVGYGPDSFGKTNSPKHWGRTSWLVMGSGGMASTPHDLYLWLRAIRGGKTLKAAAAAKYWSGGVLAGGDDRGFFCLYTEGPDALVIFCSNAHTGPGDGASALGRRLVEMVMGRAIPGPGKITTD